MAAPFPKREPESPGMTASKRALGEGFQPTFGPKSPDDVPPPKRDRKIAGKPVAALERMERRRLAIRLRVAGLDYDQISQELGCHPSTVKKDIEDWIEDQKPSESQTEALRKLMMARLEELHSTYWKVANGTQRASWAPNEKAAEVLLKIQDRQARLMGLDLQPQQQTIMVTAESIASFLGWDSVEVIDAKPSQAQIEGGSSPG